MKKLGSSKITVLSQFLDEIAPEYKDDNLVKAFSLIFPDGFGSVHDHKYDENGEIRNSDISLEEYIRHLVSLSDPQVHTALFTLVTFNIFVKQRMVKMAC